MCYRPINLKQADGRYVKVKCGQCLECLAEKRNAWVIRMEEELKSAHGKGVFFTLTYTDHAIPKNYLVYENSFDEEPKFYESRSDYDYQTPVGFRGKPSYREAPDKVLKEFYKDYTITDFNIDNNYKKYKEDYETISRQIMEQISPCDADTDDWHIDDFFDDGEFIDPFSSSSLDDTLNKFLQDEVSYGKDYNEGAAVKETISALQEGAVDRPIGEIGQGDISSQSVQSRDTREGESDGQRCKCKPYLVLSFNSCRQKDVQDWLKRGRERLRKQGKSFTYFITAEYGPRTLRPHYHGCFFGVSAEDVRFMFEDWQIRYGRNDVRKRSYKFDNITSTQGCSYCAKYCAKGFYEHPLCSRDFFYHKHEVHTGDYTLDEMMNRLEFTEYHSKHYERCIEFFNIDRPIVAKTFKLVSKGLGIGYVARTKDYFKLDEAEQNISILKHSNDYDQVFTETMEDLQRYFKYTSQKGYTFTMPQYYSKKMFSDNLRHAFANYVRSQYDKLYFQQFVALQAQDPTRDGAEISLMQEESERRRHFDRLQKKLQNITQFYNKSKL